VVPPENAAVGPGVAYHRLTLPSAALADLIRHEEPQVCVHCAGRASVPLSLEDPAADFRDSTVITFELLDAMRTSAPACRVIFLSSAAVYGDPTELPVREEHSLAPLSPYGFHKRQCELLCEEFSRVYGIRTASARIFSAYGPGLRRQVVWDICQKALADGSVRLRGTGRESRDFIHAADVARALLLLAETAPARGETYNVATGEETTISQLAVLVLAALERDGSPSFDGVNPTGNPLRWQADVSRLHALGFSPSFPLEKGVRQVANWCVAERGGG
jgi:UDP-glucose 4-epimerase